MLKVSISRYSHLIRSKILIPNLKNAPISSLQVDKQLRGALRFYSSYPPHTVINMPALSPTMTQGNIGTWQKQVGDEIQAGDVLVEIETDKAQMDFECQEEGFLAKILVDTGSKEIPVNEPIAILVEDKDNISKFENFKPSAKAEEPAKSEPAPQKEAPPPPPPQPSQSSPAKPTPASEPVRSGSSERVFATPVAKKLAQERNIPLDQIKGSGHLGAITKSDVENFVPQAAPSVSAPSPSASADYTDIPLSGMRKVIASRLTESKQTIPHYYLTIEVEMDKILKLRQALNKMSDGAYKLSVNDFIIKASALSLLKVPEVNSSWQNDYIRQYHNADISIATATPSGLITPIVPRAESKGLSTISQEVKSLAEKARNNQLKPHEYQGGTFTISNLGMFGIKSFTAIVNPPQSCILAVGTTQPKVVPAANDNEYRVSQVMNVTLSCDHRVVDGAVGAQWLKAWKGYMENPLTMLL